MESVFIIVVRKGDFIIINGSIRLYMRKKQAEKIRASNPDEEIIEIKLNDLRKLIGKS